MKIKLFAIGFIIGLIFMVPIITLKKQNDNLKKEINKLKELNIEYKWQLEEIPNIIESNKEEICK